MNKSIKLLSKVLLFPCFFSIFNSTKCFSADSNDFENYQIEEFNDEFYGISQGDKTTSASSLNDRDILSIFDKYIDGYFGSNPNYCLVENRTFRYLDEYFVKKTIVGNKLNDKFKEILWDLIKSIHKIMIEGILQVSPNPNPNFNNICSTIIHQLVSESGQLNTVSDFKKVCCNFIYELLNMSNLLCSKVDKELFSFEYIPFTNETRYYYVEKLLNGIICMSKEEIYKWKCIPGINIYTSHQEEIFQSHCKYMKNELIKLFEFLTDYMLKDTKQSQKSEVNIDYSMKTNFESEYLKKHPEWCREISPCMKVSISKK